MNYKIQQVSNEFFVYETQTNQLIKTFKTQKEAKPFIRHLNLGGGFDGFTPEFFLIKFQHIINKKNFTSPKS